MVVALFQSCHPKLGVSRPVANKALARILNWAKTRKVQITQRQRSLRVGTGERLLIRWSVTAPHPHDFGIVPCAVPEPFSDANGSKSSGGVVYREAHSVGRNKLEPLDRAWWPSLSRLSTIRTVRCREPAECLSASRWHSLARAPLLRSERLMATTTPTPATPVVMLSLSAVAPGPPVPQP